VIVEATINTVGLILIFALIGLELASAMIIFSISFFILGYKLTNKAATQEYFVRKKDEELEGISFESLNNVKTIKALGLKEKIAAQVRVHIEPMKNAIKERIFLFRFRSAALTAYYFIFEAGMILLIISSILSGKYSIAVLVMFVGYFDKVGEAIWELADVTHEIVISKISIQRLMDILNTKPKIEAGKQQEEYPKDWQEISVVNVSFFI